MIGRKTRRELTAGVLFLAPNIVGVLFFVVIPVLFSIYMALTDWDLTKHNMYKEDWPRLVGLTNFYHLIKEASFWRYFGNTLFLMLGIPISMGASLAAALLLTQNLKSQKARKYCLVISSAIFGISAATIMAVGNIGTGMVILIVSVIGLILLGGMLGGNSFYRTVFYLPSFTAGVPTFILWKHMFNPRIGPINTALRPVLNFMSNLVEALPRFFFSSGIYIALGLILLFVFWGLNKIRKMYWDGEWGIAAVVVVMASITVFLIVICSWSYTKTYALFLLITVLAIFALQLILFYRSGKRQFRCRTMEGFGSALMMSLCLVITSLLLMAFGLIIYFLPSMVAVKGDTGLTPPEWIYNYDWAKPSMIIIAFWAAIGSNNMILYIAALTNIPSQLYEAADIDGASRFARFCHVTWPQLAPTTFFIGVMAVIQGLQGGFEMAHTLTQGGPAGSTTTLSYFIFMQGFEAGRLGYSSAIAWVLFIFVFAMTMLNWTFGNKYVND